MRYSDIYRDDASLRPYQIEAKRKIFSAWDDCDSVMLQMPTGTGKTRLFTSIISDIRTWSIISGKDVKVLIVAHRIELIEQISDSLDKYKVSHGIIAGGKERNLRPQVQVASVQTITHRTNFEVASCLGVDFVIIDEAHHSTAKSYNKLWDLYPDAKKLGVTATPWRMNHRGFASIYDRLVLSKSIKEFISEGWLSPYKYYSIKDSSNIHSLISNISEFDVEGDYKVFALEKVVDNGVIRAHLLKSYLKFAKGKKGIIYSVSRKHSDHICAEYKKAGVNIVCIDSLTPRDERRLYVQRFKMGLIDIIVNVDIFSEGFDCPDIEFIQLARPTKSLVKYLQQVGRGLRLTSNKSNCLILDNVGEHLEFGLPDADRDWNTEFVGVPYRKKTHSVVSSVKTFGAMGRNFEEGDEELDLVQDIVSPVETVVKTDDYVAGWSEQDDSLLRTLYIEKKCQLSVLASVFDVEENIVKKRLITLNLIDND